MDIFCPNRKNGFVSFHFSRLPGSSAGFLRVLRDPGLWPRVTWTPWTARGWCWCKARATSWAPQSRRTWKRGKKRFPCFKKRSWINEWWMKTELRYFLATFRNFAGLKSGESKSPIWHSFWDTCCSVASNYHLTVCDLFFRCRHCKKAKPEQSNWPGVYPGDLQCSGRDLRYRREPRLNI